MKTFKWVFIISLWLALSSCAQAIPAVPTLPTPTNVSQILPSPTIDSPTLPTPTLAVSTGLEGFVTIGPTCPGPVQEGDMTCLDKPYQANIAILDSSGTQIKHFLTDANGYFKIELEPGTYIVHPESGQPLPVASDQTVAITDGTITQVQIQYDTGIR